MRIEIVLVGDELLEDLGGVQPAYISEMLRDLTSDLSERGASIGRLTVVGDTPGELGAILLEAAGRNIDLLVTIGGLGPTHDDRVRDEVALAIGQGPPVPHPESTAWLAGSYRDRSIPVPERGGGWEQMGHVPPGALPLRNNAGLACGLAFRLGENTEVRCLPGVTYEAIPMWTEHVVPELDRLSSDIPRGEASIVVRGVREGLVAPVVREFAEARPDLKAGVYLTELVDGSFRGIRVTLRGPPKVLEGAISDLASTLGNVIGATVEPSEDLGDWGGEDHG